MAVKLVPARPEMAADVYAVVDGSRDSISRWLPWAASTLSVADERAFLASMAAAALERRTFMFIIDVDGTKAGAIDLHNIDFTNHHAEIGYFLGEPWRGRGVMATALDHIEQYAFGELALNKLTILAATGNTGSRHVAERANYQLEGIQREEILDLHSDYLDAARYSKLNHEA